MNEKNALKLFGQQERLTANRINDRYIALKSVSNFKCETEEHRKARMALFFNLDNYERAIKVAQDMLEPPSSDIKTYNQKKIEIGKQCGVVEKKLQNEEQAIMDIADRPKYYQELAKLDMQFRKVLEEEYDRLARNSDLLNTEVSQVPEPHYADPNWFPDTVPADKLAGISFMLKDMSDSTEPKPKEE